MTADVPRATPARKIVFIEDVEPLPLLDPTAAARFLNVRRHTLACYRSLGSGPAYYKFGRWIRYALPDLGCCPSAASDATARDISLPADGSAIDDSIFLVDAATAARFLTVTPFCLANYRAEGAGPAFHRYARRLYYSLADLRAWAKKQRFSHDRVRTRH